MTTETTAQKQYTNLDVVLLIVANEMVNSGVCMEDAVGFVKSLHPDELIRLVVDDKADLCVFVQPYDAKRHPLTHVIGKHCFDVVRDASEALELLISEKLGHQKFKTAVNIRPIVEQVMLAALPEKGQA